MSVPVSQMWAVSKYVLTQVLRGRKRYPLVLMLEPLLRCNLACAGCGKIQYPGHILQKEMPLEQALAAAAECGTPMVSIPGGEPLMYSRIGDLVRGLLAQGRFVTVCTNALLLKQRIEEGVLTPSSRLSFTVHMDGDREAHDFAVCREGVYTEAEAAIQFATSKGFRVATNTTVFSNTDAERMRRFFDRMMAIGVEGMSISPGYSYDKAPDQEHFLSRSRTFGLFQRLFEDAKRIWKFNQSPLFLEFLMGKRHFECTPWGNPCYTVFGWQKPCYLLQEGYAQSFRELIEDTRWERYGRESGNPKCQSCLVHCGHEPTAVHHTFASFRGFVDTIRATLGGPGGAARRRAARIPEVTRRVDTGKEAAAPGTLDHALLDALDFRGDVALGLADGSRRQGYLFSVDERYVDYFPSQGGSFERVPRASVVSVERTGRDHADGKSWEAWVKKYNERKANEANERELAGAGAAG